ncbi:MAG: polysaccharide biosynthesis C-terminal domain-containing protein [Bacteroidota bacterium]|nr:polysaccharide biosynthesis C-terminal domain-containing protein [Bacteroidota bacterium]MDP3145001.1 polysaccharide biosynthesis C-terminal domain-containing protein [Bacteroidota bacterium]
MFKNIVHSLFTKGLVAVINFFILIISSRYLGVSSRGEISIFILNIAIIQIVNEIYTGYSLIYFIPKFNLKKVYIFGIIYTLIFASLSNVIVVFLNKQVPGYGWLGYVISVLIIINTFNCVLILGKEKVKTYNFLNLIQPLILLGGLGFSLLVLKEFTFNAYLYPLLFSFLVAFIFSTLSVFKFDLKSSFTSPFYLKPIIVNGLICQTAVLMHIFCNRYSYYLLPSTAKVGLYSSASSLIESVLIIANGIAPVLLARVANTGNTFKSSEITLSLSKASFVFSFIAVAVIFILPEDFFIYLLGNGYVGIKRLMMLYSPGILLASFFGIISHYFSALGKLKLILYCNSFGFIVSLIFAPILIERYDMDGAAYTVNIAYFVVALAIGTAFFRMNNMKFKRLISLKMDFENLKELVASKN